jgi:ADP-heptose:LPS heptosyltransferase
MGVSAFFKLRENNPDKKLLLATYERNVEMMRGFRIFDELISIPNGQKYAPLPIPTGESTKLFNLTDLEMDFKPVSGVPKDENKTNRHISFTKKFGLDSEFKLIPMPDYPEAKKKVEELMKKEGISDLSKNDFVVLNLISANPARSWWEPYYPILIKAIEDMGFMPIVTGTKDSYHFKGKKLVSLAGKTKTVEEYIEAVKLGAYVISTDTSAYHIAALAGIPFLAIFTGGVKPESRLGFYSKYLALEPPASLACYPCWDEGCMDLRLRWKKEPCRLIIKPEQAIAKFKELVEKYPRG